MWKYIQLPLLKNTNWGLPVEHNSAHPPSEMTNALFKERSVLFSIFALGTLSTVTQLVISRELTAIFGGNEIIIGIILGSWTLLTAVGAASKPIAIFLSNSILRFQISMAVLSLIPLLQVTVIRNLRHLTHFGGAEVPPCWCSLIAAGILAPFCLGNGALITTAAYILHATSPSFSTGRVYSADSWGCVFGGIMFGLLLAWIFDHLAVLAIVAAAIATVTLVSGILPGHDPIQSANPKYKLTAAIVIAISLAILVIDADTVTTKIQIHPQKLLYKANTPYGKTLITTINGQTNVLENGIVITSIPDVAHAEEIVHFAMCQRDSIQRVLVVSGVAGNLIPQILKHAPEIVDCIECNPGIISAALHITPGILSNKQINIIHDDPRRFLQTTTNRYDMIILNTPDPVSLQLNRTYTQEFFQMILAKLTETGVCIVQLSGYYNYVGPDTSRLLQCFHTTFSSVFPHVLVLPGLKVYFLGSKSPLSTQILWDSECGNLQLAWITKTYLETVFAQDRLDDIQRILEMREIPNTDFHPRLVALKLRQWTSQFESTFPTIILVVAVASFLVALIKGRLLTSLFVSGFTGASLQISTLFIAQITTGALYYHLTFLVTAFMFGTGLGAWLGTRISPALPNSPEVPRLSTSKVLMVIPLIGLAVFALILPLAKFAWPKVGNSLLVAILALITASLGICVGFPVSIANLLLLTYETPTKTSAAHKVLAIDLLGGFVGMLIPPILLIPQLGITHTCLICALIDFLAVLYFWTWGKHG